MVYLNILYCILIVLELIIFKKVCLYTGKASTDHYIYQGYFYWKESDEFVLHSECIRDPFKVEKRVSVSLMVLRSVQSMNDGAKDEEP